MPRITAGLRLHLRGCAAHRPPLADLFLGVINSYGRGLCAVNEHARVRPLFQDNFKEFSATLNFACAGIHRGKTTT
jgi:hypothetical protein